MTSNFGYYYFCTGLRKKTFHHSNPKPIIPVLPLPSTGCSDAPKINMKKKKQKQSHIIRHLYGKSKCMIKSNFKS